MAQICRAKIRNGSGITLQTIFSHRAMSEEENIDDTHFTEKFVFFWRTGSPFSQWHRSNFIDEDGRQYSTAEQFMMVGKAKLFQDWTGTILNCLITSKFDHR
jgi:hypothetical protein